VSDPLNPEQFRVTKKLASPGGCFGRCIDVSERFVKHAERQGMEAHTMAVYGPRSLDRAHPEWQSLRHNQGSLQHTVAVVGNDVWDWTHRQFDNTTPHPLVEKKDEYMKRWQGAY
jgi:hypothetical protein